MIVLLFAQMDSCDINCCCDVDCSDSDRLAFSGCHSRTPFNFDPRHCYQSHFVYHNNTELKFVRNEGGLFCIVKNNLPARFTYENRKVRFNVETLSSTSGIPSAW